jgi:predicted  nucleic acid-binding Zn-ribbon protein
MDSVKGEVSVVGDPPSVSQSPCSPASPRSGCSATTSAKSSSSYDRLVDSYLRRLAPLRSSLADIDRKIQKAKEAKGNSSEDTAAYLRVYADKRGDVQAKIDVILEDARQHGVAPGDLR